MFVARLQSAIIVPVALIGVPLLALFGAANAALPGFDCKKARTWSELEVCRDPTLAGLGQRLKQYYDVHTLRLPSEPSDLELSDEQIEGAIALSARLRN